MAMPLDGPITNLPIGLEQALKEPRFEALFLCKYSLVKTSRQTRGFPE